MTNYPRVLSPPGQSFFLLGPRGTGKSTWVRSSFAQAHRIDLLDEARYQEYLADARSFAGELRGIPEGGWVCVNEVQRLPSLLNDVHRFIEERRLRFVLCGSSARKLKQQGTNLLAGRALRRMLHPFVPEELGHDFDLDRALRFGTLPVIWQSDSPAEALKAYVQLYLKEEIQAEAVVRNLPGFARFLPLAALFHGQTLAIASLARDAGVARTTVSGYISIIEDTLLAFRLEAFQSRLRVREKRHPKLYWVDAGIARALQRNLGAPVGRERGHLFEGWIAGVLRAYGDYRDLFDEWYYWSPAEAQKTEVDFLLGRAGEWIAIEAKSSRAGIDEGLRGLRAISALGGLVRRIVVCDAERTRQTTDRIEIWPVKHFLNALAENRLWPG